MHLFLALLMTGIDHSSWDALLKKYVSAGHRVDYSRWKAADLPALDAYLETLAKPWPEEMTPSQRKAASINAYNALTIRWILANYPVKSIWKTKKPFITKRHQVDGKTVSLDDVENALRDQGDPRVHAVLVCAARSCPPLRREAYLAEKLDEQMDDNTRAWLSNPALNKFDPAKGAAQVSRIFDWFKADFEKNGSSVPQFLSKHTDSTFLKLNYLDYHWGLNDTTPLGADYGGLSFYWDWYRNK